MADKIAGAIIAKVRSIYGTRPSSEDFKVLVNKQNVNEVVFSLKNMYSYSGCFSIISDSVVHRGQAEEAMLKSIFAVYGRLSRFQFKTKRGFESYLIKLSEIKQILNIIIHISAKAKGEYISTVPAFLIKYTSFRLVDLTKAKNYTELLRVLENTPYHDILAPVLENPSKGFDLQLVEHEMYLWYYGWLFNEIKVDFTGSERDELETCVLKNIDLENLLLCYRFRTMFKMDKDTIKASLFPYHYRISKEIIDELLNEDVNVDLEPKILKLPQFKNIDITNIDIETAIQRVKLDFYRRKIRLSSNAAVALFSLVELLFIENGNLIKLIEGIRYSLPSNEILNLLVV